MDTTQRAAVRSFNRIAAQRVGALSDEFLGRKRPIGEARLLWEIGRGGVDVRDLRSRLGLDSGYLSRLLRALEADGLVTVASGRADGRVRRVELSARGRKEWNELESRSEAFAASILQPLSEPQRSALVDAMQTVERLLKASMIVLRVENPRSPAAQWCLEQYFRELHERFDGGFDPSVSHSVQADQVTLPAGLLLVAWLHDVPVGCGALRLHKAAPAEIKHLWVSRSVRGLGLARRLLCELEDRAREAGVMVARLDTNRSLTEAVSLYRTAGYEEVDAFNDEPYAHHWFEKHL